MSTFTTVIASNDPQGLLERALPIAETLATDGQTLIRFVSARDLHEWLGARRDFSTWFKERIAKYGFEKTQDYVLASECPGYEKLLNAAVEKKFGESRSQTKLPESGSPMPQGMQGKIEYYITVQMAKELAMVEKNDKGKLARKYFIWCEKELIKKSQELLKSWEKIAQQQTELANYHKQQALLQHQQAQLQHERAVFEYQRAESATQVARLARNEAERQKELAVIADRQAHFTWARAENLMREDGFEMSGLYLMAERACSGIDDRGDAAVKNGKQLKQTTHEVAAHNECKHLIELGHKHGFMGSETNNTIFH